MDMPKVSIILTTYREESRKYLDLAIASIKNLNYPAKKLDIILVGKPGYLPKFDGVRTIAPEIESFHNPVGVNFGMQAADADSEYVMLLNDDVIMTRDSLKNMVQAMPNTPCIMGCISNCDNQWKYLLTLGFMKDNIAHILNKRYYTYEELEPYRLELMNASSGYNQGLLLTDTLCLYANLFPKKMWDALGGFDEGFKTGYDDTDFCLRAKKEFGAHMVIAIDSLIWHFGGASTNHTLTPEIREQTRDYFYKKWAGKIE